MQRSYPGFFMSFEALDKAGKSTHVERLADYLRIHAGYQLAVFREPGDTEIGEALRSMILADNTSAEERSRNPILAKIAELIGTTVTIYSDGRESRHTFLDIDPGGDVRTESLFFLAARAQLVHEKIIPELEKGKIVICDRYADSSYAYQAYGKGEDLDWLRKVNEMTVDGLGPGLTFLLDISLEERQRRFRRSEDDRFDRSSNDFFGRVREGYLIMAREEPDRWVVIDSSRPIEVVSKEIISVAVQRLSEAKIEPIQETLLGWEDRRRRL